MPYKVSSFARIFPLSIKLYALLEWRVPKYSFPFGRSLDEADNESTVKN